MALRLLASGHAIGGGDLGLQFYPFWDYLGHSLRHGRLPLWDPDIGGGLPFLANPQTQTLYPPAALLATLLPLHAAAFAFLFGHLFWAAFGTERLARRLGLGAAAAGSAAVLVTSAPLLFAAMTRPNLISATSWLPWTLLAADRVCTGKPRGVPALAVCIGWGLLCAQPEITLLAAAAAGALAIWHGFHGRPGAVPLCAAAGLLGLALDAAMLVPLFELLKHSNRGDDLRGFEGAWALGRGDLASLFLPFLNADTPWKDFQQVFYGAYQRNLSVVYLGFPATVLAGVAVVRGGRRERALLAVAVAALLLAAWGGQITLLFERLHLGAVGFRYPIKFALPVPLALALLAALGIEWVAAAPRGRLTMALTIAGAVLLVLPIVWLPHLGKLLALSLAWVALALLAVAAVLRWVPAGPWRQWALVAVCAVDGMLCSLRVPFENDTEGCDPIFAAIKARLGPGRLDALSGVPLPNGAGFMTSAPGLANDCLEGNNRAEAGLPSLQFYGTPAPSSPRPAAVAKLGDAVGDGILATTLYLRSRPMPHEGFAHLDAPELAPLWAATVPGTAPRAELRPAARVSQDLGADLAHETLDQVRREVLLDEPMPPASAAGAPYEGPDLATIASDTGERVEVDTASAAERWLVLADLHYPGWNATVDGAPAPILVAYGMVRTVRLGPGRHRVIFRYQPTSFRVGAAVSGITLLGLLWAFRRRRAAPATRLD
ncbi:MAG TPA: hypothetical protein VMB50_04200 [Myxococcales bacterium]|nr:hypothetical protein [Myxococcales bacterium]